MDGKGSKPTPMTEGVLERNRKSGSVIRGQNNSVARISEGDSDNITKDSLENQMSPANSGKLDDVFWTLDAS